MLPINIEISSFMEDLQHMLIEVMLLIDQTGRCLRNNLLSVHGRGVLQPEFQALFIRIHIVIRSDMR